MKTLNKFILYLAILILAIQFSQVVFAFNKVQKMKKLPLIMLTNPILSPDNEKMVFDFKWGYYNKPNADIAILFLNNDKIQIVTKSNKDKSFNEEPYFSNDSMHILFRKISSNKNRIELAIKNYRTLNEEIIASYDFDKIIKKRQFVKLPYVAPIGYPLKDKVVFINQKLYKNNINNYGYIYDLKEKKQREFARNISNLIFYRYTWSISHDGNYIFYTKRYNQYNDIWLSDLRKDYDGELKLTKEYDVVYLKASPVKDEILFIVKAKEENKTFWTLFVLNAITKKVKKLYQGDYKYLGFPSWSIDGKSVIFVDHENVIFRINTEDGKITDKLNVNAHIITFPILSKYERIYFYENYSKILSVGIHGNSIKEIFPGNIELQLK